MTVTTPVQPSSAAAPAPRAGRRERRRGRRDAAAAARAAAARGRLHELRTVLTDAQALVGRGWVQGTWYAAPPGPGTPPAACLVGAVVLAGGDLGSQRVQRGLDLLWHSLHRAGEPGLVGWVPPPALRALQVRDLTGWNDAPGRSRDDVLALLDAAIGRLTTALGPGSEQVTPATAS